MKTRKQTYAITDTVSIAAAGTTSHTFDIPLQNNKPFTILSIFLDYRIITAAGVTIPRETAVSEGVYLTWANVNFGTTPFAKPFDAAPATANNGTVGEMDKPGQIFFDSMKVYDSIRFWLFLQSNNATDKDVWYSVIIEIESDIEE